MFAVPVRPIFMRHDSNNNKIPREKMGSYLGVCMTIFFISVVIMVAINGITRMESGNADIIQQLSMKNPLEDKTQTTINLFDKSSAFMPFLDVSHSQYETGSSMSAELRQKLIRDHDVYKIDSHNHLIYDASKLQNYFKI
jgi:hypothetical protein